MALSLTRGTPPEFFERHVKRLAWYALLASIVLLIPVAETSVRPGLEIAGGLGALVLLVAILVLVRDVGRYVNQEKTRRREATEASRQAGACLAASAIHDRVANLLSVTVGYAELLAEDEHLPQGARDQAERTLNGALSAARVVSTFRQSLGCQGDVTQPGHLEAIRAITDRNAEEVAPAGAAGPWSLDARTRTIQDSQGMVIATLSSTLNRAMATRDGRLLAQAPALWDVLADAQRLGISLLANGPCGEAAEAQIRDVLDRINVVTGRLQS